jgi:hypothetical protein
VNSRFIGSLLNNHLILKISFQLIKEFPNIPKNAKLQKVDKILKSFSARISPWKFSIIITFLIAQEQLIFICATSCVAHCTSCVFKEKNSYNGIHNLFEQRNMNKEILVV